MKHVNADILREYGPFPNTDAIHGVSFDGQRLWYATGDTLVAMDPDSGTAQHTLRVTANAGTAWDGTHLYQITEDRIHKIDPQSGEILASIPAPGNSNSGMAWAEGYLWVGQYQDRKIHQLDPADGTIVRTLESDRFVTGITWVDGELWHGTWENNDSELRQLDPDSGEILQTLEMPADTGVSGLESDGAERFFCGGGGSGKIRSVRRPV
ncbi:MAG: DUF5074 domain-containing protein [Pseudomonadota bacterium]|nr:DUF5074 domain-containing protein [Pseudomonadota bacterium]